MLLTAGLGAVVAAIASGGVEAAGVRIPAISSLPRQLLLGGFGLLLILASAHFDTRPTASEGEMTISNDRLPLSSRTPRPRLSPRFTGRDAILQSLRDSLERYGRVVLVGLGGVGKTQLALAYLGRFRTHYDMVWWVRAEEGAVLVDDYVELAESYGISLAKATTPSQQVAAVNRWLSRRTGWLLVFDNVEDAQTLEPYLPGSAGGHVVITSRRRMWWDFHSLTVGPWMRSESLDFLRVTIPDEALGDALADLFGDLPLALEQALAYIRETSTPPLDYLQLARRRMPELLDAGSASSYSKTVATAWSVSFDKIRGEAPGANAVLHLYSFLASEGIPHALLTNADARTLPKELRALAADRLAYNRAISALVRYSLVQATTESITIHRLVQAIVRQGLKPADARRGAAMAVTMMRSVFPTDVGTATRWERCTRFLPHALVAAERATEAGVCLGDAAWLFERIGSFLRARGDYGSARRAFEAALALLRQPHDFVEPELADVSNKLGMALRASGLLTEARDTFLQAEQAEIADHGPDSHHRAAILDNLGTIHRAMGDLDSARGAHTQALAIKGQLLGDEHPDLAVTLNGLGTTLRELGETLEARRTHARALAVREIALGDHHPDVATSLNNLGNVLADLRQLPTARALLERAVGTDEAAFGAESPPLAADLNNLGAVLLDVGELDEGRQTLERAQVMNERLLGAGHPDVAAILNNLAVGCGMQGDYDIAHELLVTALAVDEAALGTDHRDVAIILRNTADVLSALGQTGSATDARGRSDAISASFERSSGTKAAPTKWIRIDKDVAIAETDPNREQDRWGTLVMNSGVDNLPAVLFPWEHLFVSSVNK